MNSPSSGGASIPPPPNPKQTLKQGSHFILSDLLPKFLQHEYNFRQQYDPLYIQHQQDLQAKYGPTQYAQMLDALKTLDPSGYGLREQLAGNLSKDLSAGTSLTPDQEQAFAQEIRRTQARTGNTYGQAPVEQEAFTKGKLGLDLYQQRLQNAQSFTNGATPEQWMSMIPPVSADRQAAYANPDMAFQYLNAVNAAYGAQAQAAVANGTSGGGGSPWMSALGSIGQVIGTVAPIAMMAFSDKRVKTDIKPVGKIKGVKMYEWAYKGQPGVRRIGPMAQDVKKANPDAVVTDPATGLMKVNYTKLGLPLPIPVS